MIFNTFPIPLTISVLNKNLSFLFIHTYLFLNSISTIAYFELIDGISLFVSLSLILVIVIHPLFNPIFIYDVYPTLMFDPFPLNIAIHASNLFIGSIKLIEYSINSPYPNIDD